jgi:hypothetical protein
VLPNPSGTSGSQAFSIAVTGSDFYIAGNVHDTAKNTSIVIYWKDGATPVEISDSESIFATAIAVE